MSGLARPSRLRQKTCALDTPNVNAPRPVTTQRAISPRRRAISFSRSLTFGAGAAALIPLLIWELISRPAMAIDAANLLTLFYVAVFPSTLAYLCFNRGVAMIGANRAAPFFHLVPVFGAVMAFVFLGERPHAFDLVGFVLVLTGVFVASRKPESVA